MKKIISILTFSGLFLFLGVFSVQASDATTNKITITKRTAHKVYLQWNEVENADKYMVRVISYNNNKLKLKKKSKDNKAVIKGLQVNRRYKIKVKAKIEDQWHENSEAEECKTKKGAIYIEGEDYDETIHWEVKEKSEDGYKLVWSKNENPTYPLGDGDTYQYYSDPDTDEGEIYAFDGAGTYYVRVCKYLNGVCDNYSNQISVKLKTSYTEEDTDNSEEDSDNSDTNVESITLMTYEDDCENNDIFSSYTACYNVEWETEGESENGFKLVWSKNENPTYPNRSGDSYVYYSSSSQEKGLVSANYGEGTYYVRVCEYLGGACGVYSNQITLEL